MAIIPEETIRDVRERADIVELVNKHVRLRRSGKHWKGLCPFHQEKTPSFYVNPARKSFNCFGCGEYGDAISFVQKVEGKSFVEAVTTLANVQGIRLPNQSERQLQQSQSKLAQRDESFRITRAATEYFVQVLADADRGKSAQNYQNEREIPAAVSESFSLGYAPDPTESGWDGLAKYLSSKKLSLEAATRIGLLAKSERSGRFYDRFRGRLMFPITQPGGAVIGFSGRILPEFAQPRDGGDPPPKYMNSPESELYKKSETLFGLDVAGPHMRAKRQAILVEGNVDVLAMHKLGFAETVAPLGTALTSEQCKLIKRFVDKVIICFDGDHAGLKAAREATARLLDEEIEARIAPLKPGEDPDSANPEHLSNLIENPQSALSWLIKYMVREGAADTSESQPKAVRQLIPLLGKVKGRHAREEYTLLAANLLNTQPQRIWAALPGNQHSRRQNGGSISDQSVRNSPPMSNLHSAPSLGQTILTRLLVDRPEVATMAKEAGALEQITDPRLRPIVDKIVSAALSGETQPGDGELLSVLEPSIKPQIHKLVFSGAYQDAKDPETIIKDGLLRCRTEQLDNEIKSIDTRSIQARESGDLEQLRELQRQKIELRKRQAQLPGANVHPA